MNLHRTFALFLLVVGVIYASLFGLFLYSSIQSSTGYALATGNPLGGDFINLFTAGRLARLGEFEAIYVPEAFMAAQRALIPSEIGLRLWAYPPFTLFVAQGFAELPYFTALVLWSLLGLAILALGARAIGLSWPFVGVILFSPASLQCIYFGQTGNLAAGLLMLAIANAGLKPAEQYSGNAFVGALSAAALTFKAQFGLLIPIFWLWQRQFLAFVLTVLLVAVVLVTSYFIHGAAAWQAYINETLPVLTRLELNGTGAFILMIPSLFMTGRIFGLSGESALLVHGLSAIIVFVVTCVALLRVNDVRKKLALVLIATSLITPYLHVYDMALLSAAGLLMVQYTRSCRTAVQLALFALVAGNWILPHILFDLNGANLPLAPIFMYALFAVALALPADASEHAR